MTSFINTNMVSLNTQNNLSKSQGALATSIQRLSSGMRINGAKDDAAGMAIANGMQSSIKGQTVAMRNANDAISFSQTAEGALGKINDNLQRMRELAVQGANGTNTTTDSAALDKEYKALATEVTRIATDTKFNGTSVLTTAAVAVDIQVGADKGTGQVITIGKTDLETTAGLLSAGKLTDSTVALSVTASNAALDTLDTAITTVTGLRADLGATQNRMGYAISNLQTSVENQSAAKSRIMDTDFASETANLSRAQVLQQAGTAMVAQANQLPQGVLALLR